MVHNVKRNWQRLQIFLLCRGREGLLSACCRMPRTRPIVPDWRFCLRGRDRLIDEHSQSGSQTLHRRDQCRQSIALKVRCSNTVLPSCEYCNTWGTSVSSPLQKVSLCCIIDGTKGVISMRLSSEQKQELGAWLARLRDNQGLTQQEAKDRIGISRTQLCRWEAGTSIPDWARCQNIADAYLVDVEDVRTKCGFTDTQDELSSWAAALARRIEKRTVSLSTSQRQALERTIDSVLSLPGAA